ncbi:MAG: hypothetical protein KI792_12765 [Alphaproteobacteria bacterium]|nr:hypothetical protein [Alphaproteobacteria bacterium SS10]
MLRTDGLFSLAFPERLGLRGQSLADQQFTSPEAAIKAFSGKDSVELAPGQSADLLKMDMGYGGLGRGRVTSHVTASMPQVNDGQFSLDLGHRQLSVRKDIPRRRGFEKLALNFTMVEREGDTPVWQVDSINYQNSDDWPEQVLTRQDLGERNFGRLVDAAAKMISEGVKTGRPERMDNHGITVNGIAAPKARDLTLQKTRKPAPEQTLPRGVAAA